MELHRRRVLGLCGVTSGAVAGCLGSRSDSSVDSAGVDIPPDAVDITDRGADPTGDESVVPVLESVAEDGAVVYFPEGVYRFDEMWSFTGFEEFGVVGPRATIVPDDGFDTYLLYLHSQDRPASLRVEGLSFDLSAPNTGGRILDAQITSELVVRDIDATGTADIGPNVVRVDVIDPDGTGLVERLSLPDGGAAGTTISGCFVGSGSRGNIRFLDCRIEGFPDNGLYADPPAGRMFVEGGYYANSGISNVRVRGGSVVENVEVRCDDPTEGFENMRGIRLSNFAPQAAAPPAVVRNCRVELTDVTSSDGAVVLASDQTAAEIYDTEIRVDADNVPALRAKSPSGPLANGDGTKGLHCKSVRITGTAGNESTVYVVGRDSCVLDSLCVHQTGANRDGIELIRSNDNAIRNSYVNVSGEPVLLRQSTSELSSLRTQPLEDDDISLSGSNC